MLAGSGEVGWQCFPLPFSAKLASLFAADSTDTSIESHGSCIYESIYTL